MQLSVALDMNHAFFTAESHISSYELLNACGDSFNLDWISEER